MNYGDQFMPCPECGRQAESDAVDVGVGLYIAGNYWCECGWEINADGKANVGEYGDWFPDQRPIVAEQQYMLDALILAEEWLEIDPVAEERGVVETIRTAIRKALPATELPPIASQ